MITIGIMDSNAHIQSPICSNFSHCNLPISYRSEESWRTYHSTMPWPSMAWEEKDARRELASNLEVKGIPTLVILGPDNSVVTTDGRTELSEDSEVEVCFDFVLARVVKTHKVGHRCTLER